MKRNVILTVIGVVLLIAAAGGAYQWRQYQAKQEAHKAEIATVVAAKERIWSLFTRFDDAMKLALNSPRIMMAAPMMQVQAIRREAWDLKVPICLEPARTSMATWMTTYTDVMLVFLSGAGQSAAATAENLKTASAHVDVFKASFDTNDCPK